MISIPALATFPETDYARDRLKQLSGEVLP